MRKLALLIVSFIFSNVCISQTTYTFNGNGNWSDSANWLNRKIPPTPVPDGITININPSIDGGCIVNVPVRIPPNVNLNVEPGKNVQILGNLVVNYDSTIVLKDNVHVVDTTTMLSNSTPSMISQGIYQYSFSGAPPTFANGDVILGPVNGGYIRKITSSTTNGNTVTFQTNEGNIEDVFKQGAFSFALDTDSALQRPAANGYSFTFSNITVYQDGPLSIKLNNGNITLDPAWNFNFDFKNGSIKNFEMGCQNATLTSNFQVNVIASAAVSLLDKTDTLKHLTKTYIKWVPVYGIPVPVVIVMDLDFICKFSAITDATVSRSLSFNTNNNFSLGIKYANETWTPSYGFSSTNLISPDNSIGNANATVNLAIIPTFSFKLYGLAGPYASIGLLEQLKASVVSPSLDWNFFAGAWIRTTVGAKANALGYSLFNFSKFWDTDTLAYNTPFSITRISGDNQTGQANQFLTQPVKVRILDQLGSKQSNVPVYFTVTAGGGMVQDSKVFTDADGYAQTLWKLGPEFGIQYLNATAKKADGTVLQNAPLEFAATIAADSTFTDSRDSQVYTFKNIGGRTWMTKNFNLNIPGSCRYDFNDSNGTRLGRLYDWATAQASAPVGWHLPTNAEWDNLITFAGGPDSAADALKLIPFNTSLPVTNSTGFSALPGGIFFGEGRSPAFSGIDQSAYFWSATIPNPSQAWGYYMDWSRRVGSSTSFNTFGMSVRYVRD